MINIIIFIGIFMSIFLSLLLLVKKNRLFQDYILVIWLFLNGFNLYFFYNSLDAIAEQTSAILIVGALLPFITSPILFIYVCALIKPPPFKWLWYLPNLLPFSIMVASMLYFFYLGGEYRIVVSRGFIQSGGAMPFHIRYYGLILAFFSFIYPMLSLELLFRHRSRIENQFSNTEKINLNWLRNWIIISITSFWVSFIIIWVAQYNWLNYLTSFQTVAIQLTCNVVIIGFYGLRQTTIFTNASSETVYQAPQLSDDKIKPVATVDEKSLELLERLKSYMANQKPYLSSQLNLDSLASQMSVTRHDLSQAINDNLGINFFHFVNQHRVEEVKRRIADQQYAHLTLLGIAFETGFNSKSSFNHIFKKMEGITPSEYKRNLSSN